MGFTKKEYFYYGFILILFIFIGIFCFQIFFDRTLIENIGSLLQKNLVSGKIKNTLLPICLTNYGMKLLLIGK